MGNFDRADDEDDCLDYKQPTQDLEEQEDDAINTFGPYSGS